MAVKEKNSIREHRIYWMDNLRTIIILCVVLYHVGGVYEAAGLWGWFWIVDDPATIPWVGIVGIIFDLFLMPTMFFIAGYLTPASLKNKSGWEFIKGKFKRLMLPWMIAVVVLIPLYKVIFLYSRGLPQEHWSTYFHITNPNSQNWLWFLPVLFAFDILYLALAKANVSFSNASLKGAVIGVLLIGFVYSYLIGGILGFRSWTLTPIIDFENERVLIYFMVFLLGSICFRRKVFSEKPKSWTLYLVVCTIAWIPVTIHILARLFPIFYPEGFVVTPLFRTIWWSSFHLATLCLAYAMVVSFWRYADKPGRLWSGLSRNSYGVYIIHVILIGVFGVLLLNADLPAVAKYLLLILATYVTSNLVVSGYKSLVKVVVPGSSKSYSPTVDAG